MTCKKCKTKIVSQNKSFAYVAVIVSLYLPWKFSVIAVMSISSIMLSFVFAIISVLIYLIMDRIFVVYEEADKEQNGK